MPLNELIKQEIKKFKEEFSDNPDLYVQGDYISFLSSSMHLAYKKGVEDVKLEKKTNGQLPVADAGYNQAIDDLNNLKEQLSI